MDFNFFLVQSSDATTQRFLDEWRQFYPIHPKPVNCDADMPPVVEVLVGGVKMKYPTGYVLATDMDDNSALNNNNISPPCPLGKPAAKLSSGKISNQYIYVYIIILISRSGVATVFAVSE